ncbi:PDDEXK nuclease domain-containing protein [Rathayibacter festucae]|uniref:PDDEXK nuclease domain-containing protein n=1 Tax=Rathayibacter festucae TaxID=110937 RepID=UPI001FB4CD7D|nr:PDDEXK nuclease domain-containing protein [Rathayibacter festucae]MCJ1701622.1 PDDEXK nuclease domain-containing protein [Rathayibacter festucae]
MPSDAVSLPADYAVVLIRLKEHVRTAQYAAQRAVNTKLIELYWSIGREILRQQDEHAWGSGVVGRLADDLRAEFPTMTGLSRRNLLYMRSFAAGWADFVNVPQPVAHLPWGHIRILIDKLDEQEKRDWYAASAVEFGWSRDVLLNQIKNRTLERTGAAPSNFLDRLPPGDSELAQQISRDPYVFDFLDLTAGAAERDFEQALTDRITQTLAELGAGFAFVGRQVHFEVDGSDFYLDLLFFHVRQLRYVVIELKKGAFEPSFTGQLGFYIALVDDQLRDDALHRPTVGILICGDKSDRIVRYALGRVDSPMAVATYTYESLPPEEQRALPDAQHLIDAIAADDGDDGARRPQGE